MLLELSPALSPNLSPNVERRWALHNRTGNSVQGYILGGMKVHAACPHPQVMYTR